MNSEANIASYLTRLASEVPEQVALIHPKGQLTYRELEETSNRCANGLHAIGLSTGTRAVLMVKPGPELLSICFALLKLGAVPVLVDPGMGWENLGKCLSKACPEAFIGTTLAHAARVSSGWARETVRILVTVGRARFWGGKTFKQLLRYPNSELPVRTPAGTEVGAIVFTSGSTGVPKGVVYTHRMFTAQARLLRDHFEIQPGEKDLATFPLFALFDPALQVTTVFPKMDFTKPGRVNPKAILEPIKKYGVTHMFGSPALLDTVGRYAEKHPQTLTTLKRVLSAGAPVSAKTLQRFSSLLPLDADVHTPYGATEALPVCSIASREVLSETGTARGTGVCVGKPLDGVELSIIKITDDPIREWSEGLAVNRGEVGEVVVWGHNVSQEYFDLPEANELAKIPGPPGTVRHRMGDLGYLDEFDRVWFCGRKSHRVITTSGTLFTVQCEGVFNQHPAVFRSALVGVGAAPNQEPVLCVELEEGHEGTPELATEILELKKATAKTQLIERVLFHPSFPVDVRHNAKIFREKLAVWAVEQL